jgi:ABC-2 type transport system permease protein
MNFNILLLDEMSGFYKSKAMVALWIGLPGMTVILHALQPNAEGIPFLFIAGLLVSSMGGIIACVTLSTSICSDMNNHVYDLFLIRPVRKSSLLLAKFLAVLTCVLIAAALAFLAGYILDYWTVGASSEVMLQDTLNALSLGIAGISIACSLGVIIGIILNSLSLAAIAGIYAGGQLSAIITLIPTLLPDWINPELFALLICMVVAPVILAFSIIIFERRQL